jgi:hypothetical protein
MKYEDPQPMRREEAERIFASGTSLQVQDALVRVALHEPDWLWVQAQCLRILGDSDVNTQTVAIRCLGHLARIHGTLNLELVGPTLLSLKDNPALSGAVEDAFDDITMFTDTNDIPREDDPL